jgi:hypothetical protein
MRRTTQPLAFSIVAVTAAATVLLPAGAASAATATAKPAPLHATGALQTKIKVPARVRALGVLPVAVDLRSAAPAPGNQGQVGSCVSWSIGYSLAGYYASKISNNGAPYAPMYLYMKTVIGTPGPEGGSYPSDALTVAQSGGIDTQADYWQGTTNYTDGPTAAETANAANYRVTGWTTLFSGLQGGITAQTALQQSLAAGTPVSIGMPVYPAFDQINSMTPYTSTAGAIRGWHEVTAYGYDAQGLIIRNSWGSRWGSGGDAKLAWSYVNSKVDGAFTMAGFSVNGQTVVNPPTVTTLSVPKATAGSTVTITGTNLATVTSVKFGSESATSTNVTSPAGITALSVLVPTHVALGTVDVTVTNSAGTSVASAASKFTYLPAAPTLSTLAPTTATTLGGTAITITGTNLTGATVKIGATTIAPRTITATSLIIIAPVHAAGSVDVSVATAGGTTSAALTYVTPPVPAITAVAPASGSTIQTTTVVATGANFDGITSVTANGASVPFTKTSPTTLSVTMPTHTAGPVTLVAKSPAGTSAAGSATTFTYVAPPVPAITKVAPASGSTIETTTVVATGANFDGITSVTANGASVRFTKTSPTTLSVTMPAHAAGPVTLVTKSAAGTSTASSATTFTYVTPAAPTVTLLSTVSAATTLSTQVTITGTSFVGTVTATIDGKNAVVTWLSATQVRVTAPAHAAGAVPIVVKAAGGSAAPVTLTYVAPVRAR